MTRFASQISQIIVTKILQHHIIIIQHCVQIIQLSKKKVSQFHVFYLEYESLYDLLLATRRAMTNITMKKTIINLSVKSFCR